MKNNEGADDLEPTPPEIQMPEEVLPEAPAVDAPTEETPQPKQVEVAEQQEDQKVDDSDSGGCNSDWEIDDQDENEENDIDKNLPFEIQFPMRKTYTFENITISSDIDGGNMRRWIIADQDSIKINQVSTENTQNIEK